MSENNEKIGDYTDQDLEVMNTMEATEYFWFYVSYEIWNNAVSKITPFGSVI